MRTRTRWLVGVGGALLLIFGFGCLNYTKMGNVEHHREVALRRGWPVPSRAIHSVGIAASVLGAGLVGYAVGRRRNAAE